MRAEICLPVAGIGQGNLSFGKVQEAKQKTALSLISVYPCPFALPRRSSS